MTKKIYTSFLKFVPDKFIIGLFLMIAFAYWFPGIGMGEGFFRLESVIDVGISLIFFFYGLKLSPAKFRTGIHNWRVHLVIQSITFLLFPLLILTFYPLTAGSKYETLWLAVFFLAALPSTVSSSVVMVSIARGNIPAAIFNASVSGIIGIVATPLWMSIFLDAQSDTFAFSDILLELIVQILLPVVAGLLLNRFWGTWAERHRNPLGIFDKLIILLIVYKSFSGSFQSGIIVSIGWPSLLSLFALVLLLFFVVFYLSQWLSQWMGFSFEERVTTIFCGTKKSLVHGSVMHNVLFANLAVGGIILLPIMIYHAFQLFYISWVARNMAGRKNLT